MLSTVEYYSRNNHEPTDEINAHRLRLVGERVVGTLLDVGCGRGRLLRMQEDGRRVGVDVNPEKAQEAASGAEVLLADAEGRLPFVHKAFDTVTILEVLEHLPDPRAALNDAVRVCSRRLIITVPHCETVTEHCCIHCGRWTPVWGHLRSYAREDLEQLVPLGWWSVEVLIIRNPPTLIETLVRPSRLPVWLPARRPRLGKPRWWLMVLEPEHD